MSSAIVSVISLISWIIATVVLLPPSLAAMRTVWRGSDDDSREQALMAALVCSPFLFAGIMWLGAWYEVFSLSSNTVRVVSVALVVGSIPFLKNAFPTWPITLRVARWYLIVFLGWAAFRAFTPEIFWGEKPMDFSFLNYLVRSNALPPDDPWAAGHPLNYYYFGQFTWAIFHKLTGVDTAYGFNLALSAIGAGLFLAVWTFLKVVRVTNRAALLGALVITLGSNLEWIQILAQWERPLGFDFFWATSRLLTSPAISEYHSWSVMFGDLHAHLIGLPLGVVCFAILARLTVVQSTLPSTGIAWAIVGFLEALLYATNSWEAIPHGGFFVLCLMAKFFAADSGRKLSTLAEMPLRILAFSGGVFIFLKSWLVALGDPVAVQYWWVVQDHATAWQVLRHFGQFVIPIFLACSVGFISWPGRRWVVWLAAVGTALVPNGLAFYVAQLSNGSPDFILIAVCSVLAFIGAAKVFRGDDSTIGVLLLASGMLIPLTELVYVMDHTNTLFKLYLSIWTWLGVLSVAAISYLGKRYADGLRAKWLFRCALIPMLLAGIGGLVNVYSLVTFQRVVGPRPTLNGMAYLSSISKSEADMIFWMRNNIDGVPVIVEAIGDGYREFGRITMNTGLPAVLGWEYHVSQRGVDRDDRTARAEAVATIYGSEDVSEALQRIRRYRVRYIVVGGLERSLVSDGRYTSRALNKFSQHPEFFERVFKSGDTELYAVRNR